MKVVTTCLFGLESLVGEDIRAQGYDKDMITISDGLVCLEVSEKEITKAIALCNLWIATGERVLLEIGDFPATTFDELFDGLSSLCWEEFIPNGWAFSVNGYSRKSALFGIPACQSIAKKAIVKRLLSKNGGGSIWEEDERLGLLKVVLGIVSDRVSVRIDTSGDGLHKRGYRPLAHEAPIRETLAAGMIRIARYRHGGIEALVDPLCGSGTIAIEGARAARGMPPGLDRSFAAERWPYLTAGVFGKLRERAQERIQSLPADEVYFFGSDVDSKAVETAKRNAKNAKVEKFIRFEKKDVLTLSPEALENWTGFPRSLVICNPPYGERLLSEKEARDLYRGIGKIFLTEKGKCKKGIRLSVISPDDTFEKAIGFSADKRRKLYNGNIKCQLFNYFKLL